MTTTIAAAPILLQLPLLLLPCPMQTLAVPLKLHRAYLELHSEHFGFRGLCIWRRCRKGLEPRTRLAESLANLGATWFMAHRAFCVQGPGDPTSERM